MAARAQATQSLSSLTPKQVDTVLAASYDAQAQVMNRIQSAQHAADRYTRANLPTLAAKEQAEVEAFQASLSRMIAEAQPYEAEYTRRRWHRYFLVTNGNGHVHRERSCSTCFPTTRYAWLVDLSGCDERAMVAEHGTDACTVCFPNAPVLARQLGVVSKTQRERAEARTARETKRAAAAAKAAEKAITNPDGTPLMDQSGWRVTTVSAAKRELLHAAGTLQFAQPGSYSDARRPQIQTAFERIAVALAAKLGEDAELLKTAARAKAAKRGY
jgi:hypothetical protein